MKRTWRTWGVAVVVGLLAACSSGSQSDAPSGVPQDPGGSDQFSCSPGSACYCPVGGFRGTTVCSGSKSSCDCPVCPALELHEAAHVESCGGEPFGTWRLTKMDLGTSKLTLSSFGTPIGECDLRTQLTGELPNLLMTLSEGGVAKYFAPNAVAKVSWNDSCVTSKVSTFGCQSQTWTNGYNCALSCDICSCDSNLTAVSNEGSSWQRTASTLTLAPWGKDISFDYCLKDNVLELRTHADRLRGDEKSRALGHRLHSFPQEFCDCPARARCGRWRIDQTCVRIGSCIRIIEGVVRLPIKLEAEVVAGRVHLRDHPRDDVYR